MTTRSSVWRRFGPDLAEERETEAAAADGASGKDPVAGKGYQSIRLRVAGVFVGVDDGKDGVGEHRGTLPWTRRTTSTMNRRTPQIDVTHHLIDHHHRLLNEARATYARQLPTMPRPHD
ncbi:hypothetical protein [Streptomyces sp. NPDC002692]